ncbi:MAG TPA: type IX secretion system sortase PorU, partial [Paludibacteraceae bacterium]|nr:type IX secretion system sortase PorU [Paludibacteraceae bacterium]
KEGTLSTYTVALDNAVFTSSTEDETTVLSQLGVPVQTTIHIDYCIVYEKKQPSLQLLFTPIIQKENSYAKLIKADLIISSTPANKTGNQGKRSLGDEDQSIHQYASSSVLASGNWYQIRVPQTGIYKLTYEDLLSLGIQNPAQVRVFGYGGAILEEDFSIPRVADDLPEIALFMEKGSDDVFNAGDYILFHAQGTIRWQYDKYSGYYKHQQNYYATHGYYFVTERAGEGKRITSQPLVTETPVATVTDFLQYGVYEKEQVALLQSGRKWYGDKFTNTNRVLTIPFSFPSVSTTKSAKIDISVVGNSTQSSYISVHIDDEAQINKMSIFAITATNEVAREVNSTYYHMPKATSEINVKLTYAPENATAFAHLDFVRVNAYQALKMQGNSMYFRQTDQNVRYDVLQYELGNATSDIRIWDLSDPLNMVEIPTTFSTNTLFFVPSVRSDLLVREFLAIRTSSTFPKPEVIGKIANQNLHAIQQVDYVIISPNEFREQAMRLATFHQQKNGYSVVIVEPQQIYNEFSSGTPDATAYRWFLKMLYDRAGDNINNQPKALLLFGLSSHDNRGLVYSRMPLLSYQSFNSLDSHISYTTDDYYAFLDDSEGVNIIQDIMDVGVGRLPVATKEEAKIVVDKIINYANNTKKGSWKNLLAFLGDDGDSNDHMEQSDTLVQKCQEKWNEYQPIKVFLDSYQMTQTASGSTYPGARDRILNLLKSGVLIFNYVGHGSVNSLTEEQTIVRKDIENMRNENLALWVTATCDFSRYDNNKTSAGMNVLLNPYGGGIGLLTTTRTVYSFQNYNLSKQIYRYLLPEDPFNPMPLGEIMRRAKVGMGADENKLNFALLGDPMLSLSYPTNRVITTQINDAVLPDIATIKSLSLVTIKGYIENNEQNGILEEFNGF